MECCRCILLTIFLIAFIVQIYVTLKTAADMGDSVSLSISSKCEPEPFFNESTAVNTGSLIYDIALTVILLLAVIGVCKGNACLLCPVMIVFTIFVVGKVLLFIAMVERTTGYFKMCGGDGAIELLNKIFLIACDVFLIVFYRRMRDGNPNNQA